VIVSEKIAKRRATENRVKVKTSILRSGWDIDADKPSVTEVVEKEAYEQTSIGDDIDVIELHDASSPAELMYYEPLGLCHKSEGAGDKHPSIRPVPYYAKDTRSARLALLRSRNLPICCGGAEENAKMKAPGSHWRRKVGVISDPVLLR